MIVEKRPECPQCGSQNIQEKWIEKVKRPQIELISLEEMAKQRMHTNATYFQSSGDIHFPRLFDYSQLILTCGKCGFTKVFDVPENGEKRV